MNLDPTNPKFEGSVVGDSSSYPFQKTPNYSASDWIFNSNAIFSLCQNVDGTQNVACEIQNLKIMPQMPDSPYYEILFGNKGSPDNFSF